MLGGSGGRHFILSVPPQGFTRLARLFEPVQSPLFVSYPCSGNGLTFGIVAEGSLTPAPAGNAFLHPWAFPARCTAFICPPAGSKKLPGTDLICAGREQGAEVITLQPD